ncbi:hypothetical protein QQP08_003667 [Theobroma cacao]|nr:hypothetical protein QQP08_003667 [Theobroma cacao]
MAAFQRKGSISCSGDRKAWCVKKTWRAKSTRGQNGEGEKASTIFVVRARLLMKPVVIKRAWIWFTSFQVLHFGRRTRVGSAEFQGWLRFAQRSINSALDSSNLLLDISRVSDFVTSTVFNDHNPNRLQIKRRR